MTEASVRSTHLGMHTVALAVGSGSWVRVMGHGQQEPGSFHHAHTHVRSDHVYVQISGPGPMNCQPVLSHRHADTRTDCRDHRVCHVRVVSGQTAALAPHFLLPRLSHPTHAHPPTTFMPTLFRNDHEIISN